MDNPLPQMANRLQAAAAAYTRLAPLLAAPPPLVAEPPRASWRANRVAGLPWAGKRPGSQAAASGASTPRTASAAGPATVCLREVTFTYPGGSAPALVGVTLDVPAGALLAVTGPVGSGKSALARLVAGLYPPDRGQIRVDGSDPYAWQPGQRAQLGYLPQGHPVFSGTIAENVLLAFPHQADGAPDGTVSAAGEELAGHARLCEALTVAALTEDLAGMPAGVDTGIGELGVRVSGGQRQRIALARSLAAPTRAPRLIVLDDPFSALDVETEARIIRALRAAVGPQAPIERRATVVLCSTRLATFPQAEEVIVLDSGRIIERGTHTALLEAGGVYATIFQAQGRAGSVQRQPADRGGASAPVPGRRR